MKSYDKLEFSSNGKSISSDLFAMTQEAVVT